MNVGSILGISNTNHLILRSHEGAFNKQLPSIGDKVYTAERQRIGVILDIFGPVSKPFVSVKPFDTGADLLQKFQLQKGSSLFTLSSLSPVRRQKSTKRATHSKSRYQKPSKHRSTERHYPRTDRK